VSYLLRPLLVLATLMAACVAPNEAYDRLKDAPGDATRVDRMTDAPVADDTTPAEVAASVDASAAPDAWAPPPDAAPDVPSLPDSALPPDMAPPVDAPASGLIAWWAFDEGSGNRVSDRSGRGNHGDVVGPIDVATAWRAGKAGGALDIPDQVGAAVSVAPSSSIDSLRRALTIAAWVNRKIDRGNRNAAIASRQTSSDGEVFTLSFAYNNLFLWLPGNTSVRATRTAPVDSWIHVAATWDGNVVHLYQDGELVGSGSYSQQLPINTNPLLLGNNANQAGLNQPLAGAIDEVRLYDRALTAAEVQTLIRAGGS
jgi:hypothetical protein